MESLTARWLTEALRASEVIGPGQRVVHVLKAGAPGLAASSQVARLMLDVVPGGGGEPASVLAKIQARSGGDRAIYKREVGFYQTLAVGSPLPVPACYYADIDTTGSRFVLLLEDLCDATPGNPMQGCTREDVGLVLDTLAELHGRFWGGRTLQYLGWSPYRFDVADIRAAARDYREAWRALGTNHRWPVPPGLDRAGRTFELELGEALRRLSRGPRTLVHRDLHVENLVLDRRGAAPRAYLVDWQGAALAHPAMDLAYAVAGNARPECQDPTLLKRYHAGLAEQGIEYPYDELLADYRAGVIWLFTGHLRWLARYTPEDRADRRLVLQQWARVAAAGGQLLRD